MLDFFNELQINSLIKIFSDTQYRSLVTIPDVKLEKGKKNTWFANVWIADEFTIPLENATLIYVILHKIEDLRRIILKT